ncbi:anaerobic sulfatase maturase [Martelella alba]|uniref:Anaerobic sulfatase maturase n=1 Tax=Martelella alba TaxID=2590451 RepID=A0ABY2SL23_9HYPH|nr:anaerobic sulfatase maturase [Martelella alba]TKI05520.1 anaerobic sulfatase maturase [Martelella alba]
MKHAFHLMAKPTSYQCNLACDYCFYLEKEQGTLKPRKTERHMDDTVLRSYIRQYIAANPAPEVEFTWQGGEPTLAGLAFFERVLYWQRQFAGQKVIRNSLQTNGVLIDDRWAAFLAEHHFLVGISIDGTERLHDAYRKTHSGKSVFANVRNAVELFHRHQVEFNVLTVVNNKTATAPLEIYRFITGELGARFVQFIPVVEQRAIYRQHGELIYPQSTDPRCLTDWSVSGDAYGEFIIAIFDHWVRHDVGRVFVQLFDNALAAWMGGQSSLCLMRPSCGHGLVIEQNGDIYSCDHYVYPTHRLGNIKTDELERLVYGKGQRKFGLMKTDIAKPCRQCEWRFTCHGGCPKHRIHQVEGKWHNHLCAGYKAMFSHMDPYMRYMARQIAEGRPPALVMDVAAIIAAGRETTNETAVASPNPFPDLGSGTASWPKE